MAKDHGLHEATGFYINVTPAQWDNFEWASEPHSEHIWELDQEGDDFGEPDPLHRPTARNGESALDQCYCDMYPDADGGYLPFRDDPLKRHPRRSVPTKYPKRVFLATVWCLEDFLDRISFQLADMTGDALGADLTVGQYAAQMKTINNCTAKLIEAGSTNPKFNPYGRYR